MTDTFSPQFCNLAPCGAGGRIVAGARMPNRLVKVADGELTLIQAPATVVARTPAAATGPGTLDALYSVTFSPDGRTIATVDDSGTTYIWNVATRQQVTTGEISLWRVPSS